MIGDFIGLRRVFMIGDFIGLRRVFMVGVFGQTMGMLCDTFLTTV